MNYPAVNNGISEFGKQNSEDNIVFYSDSCILNSQATELTSNAASCGEFNPKRD